MSKWAKARLGDCCLENGIQTGPFGSQLHQSDYSEVGTPVIMPKDIRDGRVVEEGIARVGEVHIRRLARHRVAKNNIVYPRRGDVGKAAFITEKEVGWLCGTGCLKVDLNEDVVDPVFVRYFLALNDSVCWLEKHAVGSTMLNINAGILADLPIALPPLPMQRRIATILSDYDSAIDNARRQIALLEEAAMRLYREWFVVHTDQKWENGAVRKWFEITIGRTPPRKIAANFSESATDQKWCSIKDLQNSNIFISETAERLTKQGVDSSKIHISPAGTIFLSFKLTVGKVAITLEPMATNEAIAHFETTDRALRDYTYCYLHEFQYDTLGSTSSIGKAINSEIVRDMPFVMPDAKTLTRFSDMVSPIFDQIQNSVVFIRTLTEARDRLLPKLMSGEVSV